MYIKVNGRNTIDILYLLIGTIWLFLVMAVPRAYAGTKTALLVLLCGISFMENLYCKTRVKKTYYVAIIGFIGYFGFSLFYGILSGYKFASVDYALVNYYFITPIASFFLGMIFTKKKRWEYIESFLIYGGTTITILNIGAIMANFGVIPKLAVFNLMYVSSAVIKSNELSLRMSNEPALIFILPYMITMLYSTKTLSKPKRYCLYVGVIAGCSYAVISGRKTLEILMAGAFFILAIRIMRKCSAKILLKSIAVVLVGGIFLYYAMNYIGKTLNITNVFQQAINTVIYGLSSKAIGTQKRGGNITALLNGWLNSFHGVFIGHGLNSYVSTSLANKSTMWSYEVYYHALLYQCGLIGIGIIIFVLWSFIKPLWKRMAKSHDNKCFSYTVAIVSFVVAGGTNPMLYYVWFWAFLWAEKLHYDGEDNGILKNEYSNILFP